MITGYNTDIEHDGIIYHVQTEDKGVETPLILSLVYNRGTILASKRSPYDDLLKNGFDEKVLTERLHKQHKLMCAAIRAGRIEDLKQMTAKAAAVKNGQTAAEEKAKNADTATEEKAKTNGNGSKPLPKPIPKPTELIIPPETVRHASSPSLHSRRSTRSRKTESLSAAAVKTKEISAPAIPPPKEELVWDLPLRIVEETAAAPAKTVAHEPIIAAEAVEIVPELNQTTRLGNLPLAIEFLNETTFKAGERKTLNIRVYRGQSENFISAAQVMVKVLGSSFRPLIFHAKTDSNGIAIVHLQLPEFRSGRGAILVRVIDAGEEAELRQVIRPG